MGTLTRIGLVTAGFGLFCAIGPSPAWAAPAGCSAKPSSAIEHLVVIIQENHSFDSYFGHYCQAAPGSNPSCTDGPRCCEAVPAKDPATGLAPIRLDDRANAAHDRNHARDCEALEIDGGKMDGFVRKTTAHTREKCGDPDNFAVADARTVAPYWRLARQGALADRYFQPLVGASSGNDMYFARAAYVFDDNDAVPDSDGAKCVGGPHLKTFEGKTIGDLLSGCGVDWAFYAEGYDRSRAAEKKGVCPEPLAECRSHKKDYPCLFDPSDVPFEYYSSTRDNPHTMRDVSQLSSDLRQGKLPAVSFVKGLGFRTEHPSDDVSISDGEAFVTRIIGLVKHSRFAPKTLILVTMDEGGGFYDHVSPPPSSRVDRQPYGVRLPMIAIGAFARKGQISHTPMEHSSVVKFIEWNWLGGKTGQLGTRDTEVNDIGSLIDARAAGSAVPEN